MSPGDKWISGTLPKRPARRNVKAEHFGAKLTERVERAQQRQALGRPLATVIHAAHTATPGRRISFLAATLVIATGVVAGILSIIQGSLIAAGAAFSALLAGAAWLSLGHRRKALPEVLGTSLTNEAAELDAFLSRVSPRLPEDAVRILAETKTTVRRVVETLANEHDATAVPPEDLFFVHQAVARYLPDACRHYLSVIDVGRGLELPIDDRAPEQLLHEQLTVVNQRLRGILTDAAADRAQTLANHAAFIETKRKPVPPFQETPPR